jgi:hypothetical protein
MRRSNEWLTSPACLLCEKCFLREDQGTCSERSPGRSKKICINLKKKERTMNCLEFVANLPSFSQQIAQLRTHMQGYDANAKTSRDETALGSGRRRDIIMRRLKCGAAAAVFVERSKQRPR